MTRTLAFFIVFWLYTVSVSGQDASDSTDKSFQVVPFPNIANNQVFGWGGGVNLAFLTPLNKKDTISPVTTTVIQTMYFENKTWWAALYSELYFGEDKWRATFLGFGSNINYQFYTSNYLPQFEDKTAKYTANVGSATFTLTHRIFPKFYGGLQYIYARNRLQFPGNENFEKLLQKFGYTDNIESGLGFSFSYDTRSNIYFPDKGLYWIGNNFFYREAIGSSVTYDFVLTELSFYKRIHSQIVWASKFGAQMSFGDVPFIDENVQGFGGLRAMDLRGYNKGEYRGEQLYNLQTEFRYNFYKRWSVNAYMGMGTVFNAGDDKPLLPAAGLGGRFLASPKYKVNVGIDYAWGKDDHGIYFLIGEAF